METHFLDLDMKVPILCNKSSLLASFIAEVTFYKLLEVDLETIEDFLSKLDMKPCLY